MTKARIAIAASVMTAICLVPALAHAQASRTWVSGVGDDANPCSRTAPCKTFAGAISKTAEFGEIDTLDPGGFGAVTITKSITIDGTAGLGGVLASLTTGIIINAGSTDTVILRNLDINGFANGIAGIRVIAAGDVRVENCKIFGFNGRGIDEARTAGDLFVSNTIISNNAQTGILVLSSGISTLNVHIESTQLHNNGNSGFAITNGAHAVISHSWATSNSSHGFYADSGASIDLNDSVSSGNTNTGVVSISGATVRMSAVMVTLNGTGTFASAGSNLLSYGNNRITGNFAGNGPPTGMINLQ
jgi:Right handed beta helix region